jgi:uncharacterized hydrophobic protein (TIGR00341 family)
VRFVEIRVPTEDLEAVQRSLDDEDISYLTLSEADDDVWVLQFPVPTQAVDHVFDLLAEHGLDEEEYVVVIDAETARVPDVDVLEDRFVDGSEGEESISADEIRSRARDMHPDRITYYGMTLLSAVVAAAGLLLDSPAIVVGSMIIAPQVGSALLASVGTALGDQKLLSTGLRAQVGGLVLAIASATAFGITLRSTAFVAPVLDVTTIQQISSRISPGLLSLAVALCAGAAGAVGLATGLPVSLVGVMIAAALIPAAAAIGIGIAWGLPAVALGAFVLLVVNAVSINLAGILTLWSFGYRPAACEGAPERNDRNLLPAVLTVAVLLAVFGAASVPMSEQMAFERETNRVVESVLERDAYETLELVSVRASYAGSSTFVDERTVTVVVNRPTGTTYPRLASTIRTRLAATDDSVSVEVLYHDRQRTPGT